MYNRIIIYLFMRLLCLLVGFEMNRVRLRFIFFVFVVVWIFCVLVYNCEIDKILCIISNSFGFKIIELN